MFQGDNYLSPKLIQVKGDPKAPSSIATTKDVWKGTTPIPWMLHLLLNHTVQWWVLSKEAASTIFWVFGMTRLIIKPRSPRSLANILTIIPMSQSDIFQCKY